MGEQLGSLAAGKLADIVLLRIDTVNYEPSRHPLHTVMMVASSQDVSDVIIGGRVVLHNGEFTDLDEEEILFEGKKQLQLLLNRTIFS